MLSFSMKKEKEFDTPTLVVDVKPDFEIDINEEEIIAEALLEARKDAVRGRLMKIVDKQILTTEWLHFRGGMEEAHKAQGYNQAKHDLVDYIAEELVKNATDKQ